MPVEYFIYTLFGIALVFVSIGLFRGCKSLSPELNSYITLINKMNGLPSRETTTHYLKMSRNTALLFFNKGATEVQYIYTAPSQPVPSDAKVLRFKRPRECQVNIDKEECKATPEGGGAGGSDTFSEECLMSCICLCEKIKEGDTGYNECREPVCKTTMYELTTGDSGGVPTDSFIIERGFVNTKAVRDIHIEKNNNLVGFCFTPDCISDVVKN